MPRGRSGRTGRPNDYDWEFASTFATTLAAGAIAEASLFASDTAETLMRVRGKVLTWLDAGGSAIGDTCVVGMGLIVAPTGATVAVSPITEGGANWLWVDYSVLGTEVAVGSVGSPAESERIVVDNKAMRRLREDESIFFVIENQDVVGAPGINMTGAFRGLTAR